jgi:hypothetical protein
MILLFVGVGLGFPLQDADAAGDSYVGRSGIIAASSGHSLGRLDRS